MKSLFKKYKHLKEIIISASIALLALLAITLGFSLSARTRLNQLPTQQGVSGPNRANELDRSTIRKDFLDLFEMLKGALDDNQFITNLLRSYRMTENEINNALAGINMTFNERNPFYMALKTANANNASSGKKAALLFRTDNFSLIQFDKLSAFGHFNYVSSITFQLIDMPAGQPGGQFSAPDFSTMKSWSWLKRMNHLEGIRFDNLAQNFTLNAAVGLPHVIELNDLAASLPPDVKKLEFHTWVSTAKSASNVTRLPLISVAKQSLAISAPIDMSDQFIFEEISFKSTLEFPASLKGAIKVGPPIAGIQVPAPAYNLNDVAVGTGYVYGAHAVEKNIANQVPDPQYDGFSDDLPRLSIVPRLPDPSGAFTPREFASVIIAGIPYWTMYQADDRQLLSEVICQLPLSNRQHLQYSADPTACSGSGYVVRRVLQNINDKYDILKESDIEDVDNSIKPDNLNEVFLWYESKLEDRRSIRVDGEPRYFSALLNGRLYLAREDVPKIRYSVGESGNKEYFSDFSHIVSYYGETPANINSTKYSPITLPLPPLPKPPTELCSTGGGTCSIRVDGIEYWPDIFNAGNIAINATNTSKNVFYYNPRAPKGFEVPPWDKIRYVDTTGFIFYTTAKLILPLNDGSAPLLSGINTNSSTYSSEIASLSLPLNWEKNPNVFTHPGKLSDVIKNHNDSIPSGSPQAGIKSLKDMEDLIGKFELYVNTKDAAGLYRATIVFGQVMWVSSTGNILSADQVKYSSFIDPSKPSADSRIFYTDLKFLASNNPGPYKRVTPQDNPLIIRRMPAFNNPVYQDIKDNVAGTMSIKVNSGTALKNMNAVAIELPNQNGLSRLFWHGLTVVPRYATNLDGAATSHHYYDGKTEAGSEETWPITNFTDYAQIDRIRLSRLEEVQTTDLEEYIPPSIEIPALDTYISPLLRHVADLVTMPKNLLIPDRQAPCQSFVFMGSLRWFCKPSDFKFIEKIDANTSTLTDATAQGGIVMLLPELNQARNPVLRNIFSVLPSDETNTIFIGERSGSRFMTSTEHSYLRVIDPKAIEEQMTVYDFSPESNDGDGEITETLVIPYASTDASGVSKLLWNNQTLVRSIAFVERDSSGQNFVYYTSNILKKSANGQDFPDDKIDMKQLSSVIVNEISIETPDEAAVRKRNYAFIAVIVFAVVATLLVAAPAAVYITKKMRRRGR